MQMAYMYVQETNSLYDTGPSGSNNQATTSQVPINMKKNKLEIQLS